MYSSDTNLHSPVRTFRASVEVYRASTLLYTFTHEDSLQEFTIERVGEDGKFFGFGVAQKANVKLRDLNREIKISAGDELKICIDCDYKTEAINSPFTRFYVTESHRDENTNGLSVTAYDKIKDASEHTISEIDFSSATTYLEYLSLIANFLGLTAYTYVYGTTSSFIIECNAANIDGTETLRDMLDDIAEATGTVYYVNANYLCFTQLQKDTDYVDLVITKDDYISLSSGENRRLQTISHITELGDNVSASTSQIGSTQYLRENMFLNMADNVGEVLNNLIEYYGNFTINQFDCSWRGDYRLKPANFIGIENKDGSYTYSYIFNDVISYNGFLQQRTLWKYTNNESETADNPTSLGDMLKQTYAKVDKANRQIDLVASEVSEYDKKISSISQNQESINLSVSNVTSNLEQIKQDMTISDSTLQENIRQLEESVSAAITKDQLEIEIKKVVKTESPNSITTSTGFTFNQDGLTVSKEGSEMSTQISEDGMTVSNSGTVTLTANNQGVDALNLHATTYLIVGSYSRFEDYGDGRTGCFPINFKEG